MTSIGFHDQNLQPYDALPLQKVKIKEELPSIEQEDISVKQTLQNAATKAQQQNPVKKTRSHHHTSNHTSKSHHKRRDKEAALTVTPESVQLAIGTVLHKYQDAAEKSDSEILVHQKKQRALSNVTRQELTTSLEHVRQKLTGQKVGTVEHFKLGSHHYSACLVPSKKSKSSELKLKLQREEKHLAVGGSNAPVSLWLKLHSGTYIVQKQFPRQNEDKGLPTHISTSRVLQQFWKGDLATREGHIPIMRAPLRCVALHQDAGTNRVLYAHEIERGTVKAGEGYIVMDYYPKSVKEVLNYENEPTYNQQTLTVMTDLVEAQSIFEEQNVMHGDHKPENTRLKEVAGEWRAVVIDCDDLVQLPPDNTAPPSAALKEKFVTGFTKRYCEQANYAALDAAKTNAELRQTMMARDRIAIGKSLYELCTGVLPAAKPPAARWQIFPVTDEQAFEHEKFKALPVTTRLVIQKLIAGNMDVPLAELLTLLHSDKQAQQDTLTPAERLECCKIVHQWGGAADANDMFNALTVELLLHPTGNKLLLADTLDEWALMQPGKIKENLQNLATAIRNDREGLLEPEFKRAQLQLFERLGVKIKDTLPQRSRSAIRKLLTMDKKQVAQFYTMLQQVGLH